MAIPVSAIIDELNQIDAVSARQLGGPNARVGKNGGTLTYTVAVEFDEQTEAAEDGVTGVVQQYREEPNLSVGLQTDDGWGEDTWAIVLRNI